MPTVRCGPSFTLRCLDLTAFLPARSCTRGWGRRKKVYLCLSAAGWEGQGKLLAHSRSLRVVEK